MNYLAHAYLSFNNSEILVGNMISDFVKGKKQFDYPAGILNGIRLHRQIDRFTDDHEATKMAKEVFRPAYRLYSGAFIDVVYDHFLATDKDLFSTDESLFDFTNDVYNMLDMHIDFFPERFLAMFPYMKSQNWLYNYRLPWGIEKSFGGFVRRSRYLEESDIAFNLFNENYDLLKSYSRVFIREVIPFARNCFHELTTE